MIAKALLAATALSIMPASATASVQKPEINLIRHFDVQWLPYTGLAVEARILVDPTTNSVGQSGWLGVGNTNLAFLQCGWQSQRAQGTTPQLFCEIWKNNSYQWMPLGQAPIGSYVTVGLSTNGKGQWLCWVKLPNGKWTVAWMGNRDLYPGVNRYYVATETELGGSLPRLVEQTRVGNGAWK